MRSSGLHTRALEARSRLGNHPPARTAGHPHGSVRSGSMLRRAVELRSRLEPAEAQTPAPAENEGGISLEDRREIQSEIEEITRRNRLSASPEDFIIRPQRKGYIFPLAVNVIAVVL